MSGMWEWILYLSWYSFDFITHHTFATHNINELFNITHTHTHTNIPIFFCCYYSWPFYGFCCWLLLLFGSSSSWSQGFPHKYKYIYINTNTHTNMYNHRYYIIMEFLENVFQLFFRFVVVVVVECLDQRGRDVWWRVGERMEGFWRFEVIAIRSRTLYDY